MSEKEPISFEPVTAEHILESDWPEPAWAVEGWWTQGSFGVIGGAPKSFKSTLGLELMVSFSTGCDYLGLYPTPNYMTDAHGLIIQEENALPNLRRQISRIAVARGLGHLKEEDEHVYRFIHQRGTNLNLSFLNLQGFTLTDVDHIEWLVQWIKDHHVGYVLFDPLYMMLGAADENVGKELRPVLHVLTKLKEETGCAGILVHHTGKASDRRGGRALLGHTYLHGWYEVAMFPAGTGDWLRVEHEFREVPPHDDHHLILDQETWQWEETIMEHDASGREHPGKMKRSARVNQYLELVLANPDITDLEAKMAIGYGEKTISRYRDELKEAGLWPEEETE